MSTATLNRPPCDTGIFHPEDDGYPGNRDECGFPGPDDDNGAPLAACPEIPVATITETCPCGHIEMVRTCRGHAREVGGWEGSFIGGADSPGMLTCPRCRDGAASHSCALSVMLTWDDMRPAAVLQHPQTMAADRSYEAAEWDQR